MHCSLSCVILMCIMKARKQIVSRSTGKSPERMDGFDEAAKSADS